MKIDNSLPVTMVLEGQKSLTTKPTATSFEQVLEAAKESTGDKEIRDAAQQLEAIFLYQLFTQMRKTVPEGGLFEGQNLAGDIFQGMFDQEVSLQAALGGGTGLADIIYQQMAGQVPNRSEEETNLAKKKPAGQGYLTS